MRRFIHTTIKMFLALTITTLIAFSLNLENAITAGILAVLFVQLTRVDSYINATKRIIDGLLALGLSTVFFLIFGYSVWVFMFFSILFIGLSFALKISVGIVPSLVLVSHLLLEESFSSSMLINASLLLIISAAIAMILNLIYPLNTYKYLSDSIKLIDQYIRQELSYLSDALNHLDKRSKSYEKHKEIYQSLKEALNDAELMDKDLLFDTDHRHIAYIRMRHAQMERINRMYDLLIAIEKPHANTKKISKYIYNLVDDIGEVDKATTQLDTLKQLKEHFKKSALPDTRDAFETRAILFQMTFELESFLKEKIKFHEKYKPINEKEAVH